MQPMLRVKATHDPASMEGQSYLPIYLWFDVAIDGGSGASTFWTAPAGAYVESVVGWVNDSLDAGTVDIGDEDTAGLFIANSEWTETSDNVLHGSSETTLPNGILYTTAHQLKVTVGGAATAGNLRILLKYFNFNEMVTQGFHNSITIP